MAKECAYPAPPARAFGTAVVQRDRRIGGFLSVKAYGRQDELQQITTRPGLPSEPVPPPVAALPRSESPLLPGVEPEPAVRVVLVRSVARKKPAPPPPEPPAAPLSEGAAPADPLHPAAPPAL